MQDKDRVSGRKEDKPLKRVTYKIMRAIQYGVVIFIGIMAGAGVHHHYMLYAGEPTEVIVVKEEVVPVQPVMEPAELQVRELTEEELQEEEYYDSLELLALCVEAEAGNQDLTGKRMVAAVVLNRVEDPDWPDTITEVITQPYQFSTWWNGSIEMAEPSDETFEAVRMELEERSYPGLYYFTSEGYSEYGTPWRKVGDHYFSTK